MRLDQKRLYCFVSILVCFGLIEGCTKFAIRSAYNNLETVAMLRIDGLLDLKSDQEKIVRPLIRELHHHHRRVELPKYKSTLLKLHKGVDNGLSEQELSSIISLSKVHTKRFLASLIPAMSKVLIHLDSGQIDHLERRLAQSNAEMTAEVKLDKEARLTQRSEKMMDFLDDFYGDLDAQKRESFKKRMRLLPDVTATRLKNRIHKQQLLISFLRSKPDQNALQEKLKLLLLRPEGNLREYSVASKAWDDAFVDMLVEFDKQLSRAERLHTMSALQDWMAMIDDLHASSSSSASTSASTGSPVFAMGWNIVFR